MIKFAVFWIVCTTAILPCAPIWDQYTRDYRPCTCLVANMTSKCDTLVQFFDTHEQALGFANGGKEHGGVLSIWVEEITFPNVKPQSKGFHFFIPDATIRYDSMGVLFPDTSFYKGGDTLGSWADSLFFEYQILEGEPLKKIRPEERKN